MQNVAMEAKYVYIYTKTYPILANQIAEFEVYNRSELPTAKGTNQLFRRHKAGIVVVADVYGDTAVFVKNDQC